MKQLKAVLVGFGNRGGIYADYSLKFPEQLKIVGVVEVNSYRLKNAKERYSLDDNQVFDNIDDFLKTKTECDFVINATMDQMHYDIAMKILNAGYNMLIEKPVTAPISCPIFFAFEEEIPTFNANWVEILTAFVLPNFDINFPIVAQPPMYQPKTTVTPLIRFVTVERFMFIA